MQWQRSLLGRSSLAVPALCGCLALSALAGCDAGNQTVRDDVIDVETPEGESVQIRDGEIEEDINLDVNDRD